MILGHPMRAPRCALVALLVVAAGVAPAAAAEDGVARAAFETLKGLEGTWKGDSPGEEGGAGAVTHVFRVSANGSVVMETMNPGSPHEMINMYHMDGDDLVLTHYCAGGNQPTMKLGGTSTKTDLSFDFTGGTNLDPAKDSHIHSAHIVIKKDGTLESAWTAFAAGKEAGTTTFMLSRD